MMKTLTLILLCSLIFVSMRAQPVISEDGIPQIGDTWKASITLETPEPGESGANVTWDFSDLNVEGFYFEIIFNWVDPAETPYVDSFPDATLCADLEAPGIGSGFAYGYYRNDDSGYQYLGSGNQFGFDIFTDPQTFSYIDLNFEETVVDSYTVVHYTTFSSPRISEGLTSNFYDAYGTLLLPGETISDAIRIFQVDIEGDSIDVAGLTTVHHNSTTTYAWVAEGSVFPVAQHQMTFSYSRTYLFGMLISEEVEGPDTTFSINPDYGVISGLTSHVKLPALDVFPTAARDEVNVRIDEGAYLNYSIFSLSGNQIGQGYLDWDVTVIGIAHFAPGYFVIKVDGYAPHLCVKLE